jgi:hypothetical protein
MLTLRRLEGADAAVGCMVGEGGRCTGRADGGSCAAWGCRVCVQEGASASHRKTSLVTAHTCVPPPPPPADTRTGTYLYVEVSTHIQSALTPSTQVIQPQRTRGEREVP